MAITDEILGLQQEQPQQQSSWIQDLISNRYQPQQGRIKRTPVGFDFKRDPFDPSSYYKQLGQFRDISRAATGVVQQEVANDEERARQKEYEDNQKALENALKGINPKFEYANSDGQSINSGFSKKYHLRGVSSNTGHAADYWGSKYGIKVIGGLGPGSVPGSDHPKGRALDFMINNIKHGHNTGTALANDVIAHYKEWNVKYVIWNRYIWQPGRGWHKYSGPSPHTDHVHVSFNK